MKKLIGLISIMLMLISCNSKEENAEQYPQNVSTGFIEISKEELLDWDRGVLYSTYENNELKQYILLASADSINEQCVYNLSSTENVDINSSISLVTDLEGNLQTILVGDIMFAVTDYENTTSYMVYDSNGENIGSFSIPKEEIETMATRGYSPINVFKHNIGSFFEKSKDFVTLLQNIQDGKLGEIFADFASNKLIDLLPGGKIAKLLTKEGLTKFIQLHYDRLRNWFIGNATIEVTSVSRISDEEVLVLCQINDMSSIPSDIPVVCENGAIMWTTNSVFFGVALGNNESAGLYLHDQCSNLRHVSNSSKDFSFTLPIKAGQPYYFRPFLIPEDNIGTYNPMTCIRYGNARKYIDNYQVKLENFKSIKTFFNGNNLDAEFTIDGSVPEMSNDVSNWGISVYSSDGKALNMFFSGDQGGAYSSNKTFTCKVSIPSSLIQNDKTKITIKPFIQFWNQLPALTELDPQEYWISVTNQLCPDNHHPHMIDLGLSVNWSCCNAGASAPSEAGVYYYPTDVATPIGRRPTPEEISDLHNLPYHTGSLNNINGIFISGNGNTIFIPAAGCMDHWYSGGYTEKMILSGYGTYGHIISSERKPSGNSNAVWYYTGCFNMLGWTGFGYNSTNVNMNCETTRPVFSK